MVVCTLQPSGLYVPAFSTQVSKRQMPDRHIHQLQAKHTQQMTRRLIKMLSSSPSPIRAPTPHPGPPLPSRPPTSHPGPPLPIQDSFLTQGPPLPIQGPPLPTQWQPTCACLDQSKAKFTKCTHLYHIQITALNPNRQELKTSDATWV